MARKKAPFKCLDCGGKGYRTMQLQLKTWKSTCGLCNGKGKLQYCSVCKGQGMVKADGGKMVYCPACRYRFGTEPLPD